MALSLAHLGPAGTYSEEAAKACAQWLIKTQGQTVKLHSYSSIPATLKALTLSEANLAIVPCENSVEGSVNMTLDALWQGPDLHIQHAIVRPIANTLITHAASLDQIKIIYSHPQALGQCQQWLQQQLPWAEQRLMTSTTEGLVYVQKDKTAAAIAAPWAASLHNLPILATDIQDFAHNCTRFWILSRSQGNGLPGPEDSHTSLAFSLKTNQPGSLVQSLNLLGDRQINLSRIESRPSKRALGDYVFFLDLEVNGRAATIAEGVEALGAYTDTLKIFGSYHYLYI